MIMWGGSGQLLFLATCILFGTSATSAYEEDQGPSYQRALNDLKVLLENKLTMAKKDDTIQRKLEDEKPAENDEWIHIHGKVVNDQGPEGDEDDSINIDTEGKTMTAVIDRNGKKEITVSDYNKGVVAVLTQDDKICRVMEMAPDDMDVDLEKEKDIFKDVSKKEDATFRENSDDMETFKATDREVKEDDVGKKIWSMCKSHKTVWMELMEDESEEPDEEETETQSDAKDGETERMLEAVDKRGRCWYVSVWKCWQSCSSVQYRKTHYCCKKAFWRRSTCKKTCYRQTEVGVGCKKVCGLKAIKKCKSSW